MSDTFQWLPLFVSALATVTAAAAGSAVTALAASSSRPRRLSRSIAQDRELLETLPISSVARAGLAASIDRRIAEVTAIRLVRLPTRLIGWLLGILSVSLIFVIFIPHWRSTNEIFAWIAFGEFWFYLVVLLLVPVLIALAIRRTFSLRRTKVQAILKGRASGARALDASVGRSRWIFLDAQPLTRGRLDAISGRSRARR